MCHRNSLNHSNVLSRLFLSELLNLEAGSSARWQSLIQIWIMYDDEYNASVEWCIEIGTQGRCMWARMGVCVWEGKRLRDIISHPQPQANSTHGHTITPTNTQQNQKMVHLSFCQVRCCPLYNKEIMKGNEQRCRKITKADEWHHTNRVTSYCSSSFHC